MTAMNEDDGRSDEAEKEAERKRMRRVKRKATERKEAVRVGKREFGCVHWSCAASLHLLIFQVYLIWGRVHARLN